MGAKDDSPYCAEVSDSNIHQKIESLDEASRFRFLRQVLLFGLTEPDKNFYEVLRGIDQPESDALNFVKKSAIEQFFFAVKRFNENKCTTEEINLIALLVMAPDNFNDVLNSYPAHLLDYFNQYLSELPCKSEKYLKMFGERSSQAVEAFQRKTV